MKNSKIIDVLRTFSKEELRNFGKMVEAPFFTKRKKVRALFDVLAGYYPDFDSPHLTDEKVYAKIFPGQKYNITVLRKLSSELYKLSEEYLIRIGLEKNFFLKSIFLLQEQTERKLEKNFFREYEKLREEIDKKKYGETVYHFANFLLSDTLISFHLANEQQRLICDEVVKISEFLICYSLIRLCGLYHDKFVNEKAFKLEYENAAVDIFFESFDFKKYVTELKRSNNPYYPIIAMNYYIYMSLKYHDDESNFANMKKFVYDNLKKEVSQAHVMNFRNLRSACELYIHLGKQNYRTELFSLYEFMLKNIYDKKQNLPMPIAEYTGITNLGIDLKKFSMVEKFLDKYKTRIVDESREDVYNLNKATLEFYKGKYDSSLDYLNRIHFDTFVKDFYITKANINNLRLMNYFELSATESFYSLADSYKHFLKDNKVLSPRLYKSNKLFLENTERLFKYRLAGKNDDISMLEKKITAGENFRNRAWLIEKCKEQEV